VITYKNEEYNIEADFEIPEKGIIDFIVSIINYLKQHDHSDVFLTRTSRIMRLVAYMNKFRVDDKEYIIDNPLQELDKAFKNLRLYEDRNFKFIDEVLHEVSETLSFIDEGIYAVLVDMSDRFKEEISTVVITKEAEPKGDTDFETPASRDELINEAKRLQKKGYGKFFKEV